MRIESSSEGFSIFLNDRIVLHHGHKVPLVEFGNAEALVRQRKGTFRLGQKRYKGLPAKQYTLLNLQDNFIEIDFEGLTRMSVREDSGRLRIGFSRYDSSYNRFILRLPAIAGESVFGCGEQFSRLDLKGCRIPLWPQEQGHGRSRILSTLVAKLRNGSDGKWHSTSYAQPSFITSSHFWLHLKTKAYCTFDFRRPKQTSIEAWAIPEEIFLGLAPDAPATVTAMSAIAGSQPEPPVWTWDGTWLGVQGGSIEITKKLQAALDAGIKVSAVWVQDWCGHTGTSQGTQPYWNWEYDQTLYPALPDEIAKFRKAGIRFLGYINPFLSTDATLYKVASEKGYCVKHPEGGDYLINAPTLPVAMIDLWNPDAFEWIKSIIKHNLIGIGMAGWMADFGEHLPVDSVLHGGLDGLLAHNEYPVLWAKANAEAIRESGKDGQISFFMRSGWAGSVSYAQGFFAGDQLVNWNKDNGLPSVIPAGISAGISGVGNWHFDIGGYTTVAWIKRSRECFMRWAEMAAFSPQMRTNEGSQPDKNAQFYTDPALLSHFARMSQAWLSLAPYHKALADEYSETGLPPIRHPWLHYENDIELRRLKNQYLYGRDLLIAPVSKPDKELWEAWLPDDEWVHLWTSREFRGGAVTIDAPLGYPPVFYRGASKWAGLFDSLRKSLTKFR